MVLPCLMGVFNSIGGSCLGWIGEGIKRETALLFSYADNIANLRKQVQDLSDAIKSVDDRTKDAANSRGATLVDAVVVRLLERMNFLKAEASKIIADEERSSDSTCLMGLRPNLLACCLRSKSAKKAINEALELLEKEKTLDRVVANVDYSKFLGVTPIEEFEEFESRELVSKKIVAALKDPNVNKVGIYGMGGTGKTTLAEKIGAKLQLDSTFSYVVLVTVSEKQDQVDKNYKPDLSNIQKQIAGGFKIELQGKTLKDRTVELREQLQKKDKVLIIFDDIWSGFELKDVGIPIGNIEKKFKIFMTSRSEAVLLKEMNSKSNFGLDSLPHPDAWTLFDRMVGGHIEYSNWRPTAEQVVKQCGGIPIILVTIAKSLRNEVSESWEDVLTQLKKFDGENILEAYKMIEVSYEFLKSEEKKKLLLLCAQLNHRSIPIDDLLKYAMGLNLFSGCKKLKEVRNRLHKSLSDLKGCCLLQDGNEQGMIKMHDVIHKFASYVAFRDHHVFSVANDGELQDWPSKDELEHFSTISLPECSLPLDQMLPVVFDNPKLESFLMFRSEIDASFQIPDKFFVGMIGLKLMHLTLMPLSPTLVSSFEALVKLQTLCLDGCELSDISVIGELPMLQVLTLVDSSIVLVPKDIGKLGSTLKLLDLRHCEKLERIAAGVIFRLTLLEDLRIGKSYRYWERLKDNHKRSNIVDEMNDDAMASLEEFKNLQNLINLEIYIYDNAKMFPKDLIFKRLETFIIVFGYYWWARTCDVSTTALELNESTTVGFDGEGSKALLTSAENLSLTRVTSCVSVSEMDPKGFPKLKHLHVSYVDGIQYIVKKKDVIYCIFSKLETLDLFDLPKLERISDDHILPAGAFENLRVINVRSCELLNDLFSSNVARGILCLQEISIVGCWRMESIIVSKERESENEEIQIGFTHQLRVLKLWKVSSLVSLCSFKQTEGLPSPITPLFNKKIMFPKLEVLDLKIMKIEKIWDDHLAITAEGTCWLQNLTILKVTKCHNLRYLFTFSMIKSLTRLKELNVENCESIEEIIITHEGEIEGERLLLFPMMESLYLDRLPKLKIFCHANLLECQSSQMLSIDSTPLLNAIIGTNESSLFDKKVIFPKLEKFILHGMKTEKICDVDHISMAAKKTTCWFQNLTSLEVCYCDNLRYLFTSSMVKSLAKLKQLEVNNCKSIEEIVAATGGDIQLSFPKLDYLNLKCLPKLKRFCEANLLECLLLRELVIKECFELKTFISANGFSCSESSTTLFSEKVAFHNMGELEIASFDSLEKVFDAQNLTSLEVYGCDNLSYLFTSSVIKSLEKLKQLKVSNCKSIEEIVVSTTRDIQLSFTKLDDIELENLPKLKRFCHANLLEFQSLEKLVIRDCPELKTFMSTNDSVSSDNSTTFFTEKVAFPEMEELEIAGSDSLEKVFNVQNLTTLEVCGCDSLNYLFTSSMVRSLAKLKQLKVSNCKSIEEIVVSTTGDIQLSFPKLDDLELEKLPKLKRFCHANLLKRQSLEKLSIRDCPELKTCKSTNDYSDDSTILYIEFVSSDMEEMEIRFLSSA